MSTFLDIRTRLGLTQAELGAGLGVTQGAISFYERGVIVPSPSVAARLITFAKTRKVALTYNEIYGGKAARS
jgi:transcriptional regulator with XRE-family HTH domain